jgi:hypothetical protein
LAVCPCGQPTRNPAKSTLCDLCIEELSGTWWDEGDWDGGVV